MTTKKKSFFDISPAETPRFCKFQNAVLSAYTGVTCGDFSDFHQFVEYLMDRPVFTHEFANEKFQKALKKEVEPIFMYMIGVSLDKCFDMQDKLSMEEAMEVLRNPDYVRGQIVLE